MEKILVTQALNELKTLDSRIYKEIEKGKFVAAAKISEKNITPATSKEEFEKRAKASMDSINALIERRQAIKAAVIESNAKTIVDVCGEKMSVARIIDLKNSIEYKKMLLNSLRNNLSEAIGVMTFENDKMKSKIDNLVTTAFGKESKPKISEEDYNSIANPYKKANEVGLVDPIHAEDEINKLNDYIDEFESTVDSILQVSNCTTYIEI